MKLTLLALSVTLTAAGALESVRSDWRAGRWQAAVTQLDALLDDESLSERDLAKVWFAKGVVLAEEREGSPVTVALAPFGSAKALAGPGQLRLDALYDAAWVLLDVAEREFALLNQPPQPPAAPPGPLGPASQPAAAPEEPERTIDTTRAAYGRAKDAFLERLAADWRDEDTRANLEWIQRRLRELDELEQQQEEQEQEQQDSEDQQQDQEKSDDQQQESDQQEQQDQQESDDQQQNEQDQQQEPNEEEQAPEDQESEQEQPPTEGEEQEPEGEEEAQAPPPTPEERFLTKEEVQRLLDRLQALEEEGERVQAALRNARRIPVDRDW